MLGGHKTPEAAGHGPGCVPLHMSHCLGENVPFSHSTGALI